VLYIRSLQLSPLSLTVPYLSFTPAFLLVVAKVMLGESATAQGGFGVLLVSFGGFILHASSAPKMEPSSFVTFVKNPRNIERGTLYMLAIAAIWSVSASFDKMGMQHTNAAVFGGGVLCLHAVLNLSFSWWELGCPNMLRVCQSLCCENARTENRKVREGTGTNVSEESLAETGEITTLLEMTAGAVGSNPASTVSAKLVDTPSSLTKDPEAHTVETLQTLPIGPIVLSTVMGGVSFWLHLRASSAVLVSYAIAIKRAGCLVSMVVGKVVFEEEHLLRRLPGVLIMLLGVTMIVLQ